MNLTDAEAAFDAASATLTAAAEACRRNRRSRAAAEAYSLALVEHTAAAEAMRAAQDAEERAATVARRLALVAPRRALLARQLVLALD